MLVDNENSSASDKPMPVLFVVSSRKFVLMYFATLGLYQLYWFYRQWQVIEKREPRQRNAIWRSLFSIIFCFDLFNYIGRYGALFGQIALLSPFVLALMFIAPSLSGLLPLPWPLLGLLALIPVLYVNAQAHQINFHFDNTFAADDVMQTLHYFFLAMSMPLWVQLIVAMIKGPLPA